MSRKRDHIPLTLESRLTRLFAVATEHVEPGGVYVQFVAHDPDCPSLATKRLVDCRCEPEFRQPRRVA